MSASDRTPNATFYGVEVERNVTHLAPPDTVFVQQQERPTRKYIVTSARPLTEAQLLAALSQFEEKMHVR